MVVPSDIFNPLYWHLRDAFNDPSIRYINIFGGSSASKTYTVVQASSIALVAKSESTIVFRKESTSIDDSIYKDFKYFINENGPLAGECDVIRRKVRRKDDKGEIVFRGLDDPNKVKGIARFKRAIMEEFDQFDPDDDKQVRKRVRGMEGQQIIRMWNPVSEDSYVKTDVIDPETWVEQPMDVPCPSDFPHTRISGKWKNKEGDALLMKVTYLDNWWVMGHPTNPEIGFHDVHVIADFEKDKVRDPNYYRIYALGEYGVVRTGQEFFKGFSYDNVKEFDKANLNEVWMAWDFNTAPHMTCLFFTIYAENGRYILHYLHELLPKGEHARTHVTARKGKEYLEDLGYAGTVKVCGDSTGRSKSSQSTAERKHDYHIIKNELGDYWGANTNKVVTNPNHVPAKKFINRAFEGEMSFDVRIDPSCKTTIADMTRVKEAADGSMEKIKKKINGVTCEPYGHAGQCVYYGAVSAFNEEFKKFTGNRRNRRIS